LSLTGQHRPRCYGVDPDTRCERLCQQLRCDPQAGLGDGVGEVFRIEAENFLVEHVDDVALGRRCLGHLGHPEHDCRARNPPGQYGGIALQRHWESLAFAAGGGGYKAPGQLVGDLLAGRPSTGFGAVLPSYRPGVHLTDLGQCLPGFVIEALHEALPAFGRQIPRYDDPDAVMTGVETRTSSPIRITRGADFQSLNTPGLYPAGEGAGYAGGILSAAVDGIKVAEAVALKMLAA